MTSFAGASSVFILLFPGLPLFISCLNVDIYIMYALFSSSCCSKFILYAYQVLFCAGFDEVNCIMIGVLEARLFSLSKILNMPSFWLHFTYLHLAFLLQRSLLFSITVVIDCCGHLFVCRATINHLKSVFASKGSDSWWSLPVKELLPDDVISQVI